ncbi:hypothetical protein H311_01775, partial [Anncaliia algerae PRA109]
LGVYSKYMDKYRYLNIVKNNLNDFAYNMGFKVFFPARQ